MRLAGLLTAIAITLCLGCSGDPSDPNQNTTCDLPSDEMLRDNFYFHGHNYSTEPPEVGTWGYPLTISNSLTGSLCRYYFSGPGDIFWVKDLGDGIVLEPVEYSKTYYGTMGAMMVYRPPVSSDGIPEQGTLATLVCEVPSFVSGEWVRSQDFTFRVVPRKVPMNLHLTCFHGGNLITVTPSIVEPQVVDVKAGSTLDFQVSTSPYPADGIQIDFGLTAPQGYAGLPGRLSGVAQEWQEIRPPRLHYFKYKAPEYVESAIDVVAWVSVLDPWADKWQKLEITFRVTPK